MARAYSYDEFWATGVGTFMWVETIVNMKATLSLLLKIPYISDDGSATDRLEVIRIFPRRTEENWAASGPIMAWDRNYDQPTLHGSLWHRRPNGWHGFLEQGELRSA